MTRNRSAASASVRAGAVTLVVVAALATLPGGSLAQDTRTQFVIVNLAGGYSAPVGSFRDEARPGWMGSVGGGIANTRYGVRLQGSIIEPRATDMTNTAFSVALGRPVEVSYNIFPLELQGLAAFPGTASPISFVAQAGAGPHFTRVRVKGSEESLERKTRLGFSLGGGAHFTLEGDREVLLTLDAIYHNTGGMQYMTYELGLAILFGG